MKLNPTNTERAKASHTITTKIPNTTPWGAYCLIDALLKLNPANTGRAQDLHTITTALQLPKTTPEEVNNLINTLLKLNPTNTEHTKAQQAIIETLPHASSRMIYELVGLLRQFAPVDDWLAALGIEST